jgi:hypothetical protein
MEWDCLNGYGVGSGFLQELAQRPRRSNGENQIVVDLAERRREGSPANIGVQALRSRRFDCEIVADEFSGPDRVVSDMDLREGGDRKAADVAADEGCRRRWERIASH